MRVALITGVCGGVGRATASQFRRSGWRVVGIDRAPRPDELEVDEFVRADVSTDDGMSQVRDALDRLGRLDALVNNAALQINQPITATSDAEWDAVMNTNLRPAFQLARDTHDLLATARGAIVNVSSVHAVATSENVAAYAVSKGALVSLTRSTALEFAQDEIRCNAVLLGAVRTPMLLDGLGRRPHPLGPAGNLEVLVDRTPLGFVAEPRQVAPTIVHLADGEASPYITGQTIIVDGGATLRLGTE